VVAAAATAAAACDQAYVTQFTRLPSNVADCTVNKSTTNGVQAFQLYPVPLPLFHQGLPFSLICP